MDAHAHTYRHIPYKLYTLINTHQYVKMQKYLLAWCIVSLAGNLVLTKASWTIIDESYTRINLLVFCYTQVTEEVINRDNV